MTEPTPLFRARIMDRSRQPLSASDCAVVGVVFAVMDAALTWYGIRFLHAREGNPFAQWIRADFGLTTMLVVRMVVGCGALGLLAFGTRVRLPGHGHIVNRVCGVVVAGVLVLWGTVVVSNTMQLVASRLV